MKKSFQYLFLILVSTSFLACQESVKDSNQNEAISTEGMLQHNVYFYLNDSISQEEIQEFEAGLKKLLSIDEVYKSEVGVTGKTKSREVTDHEFEYSIYAWFKNMDDYEVYAEHPDHLDFIDRYKHLWADVKVYDSEIISNN